MELPDFYLKKFVAGAELHIHLTGNLKDFATNLHTMADKLQHELDSHSVAELLDPRTTSLKFSRPIEFDNDGEGRIRLIETWETGFDVAITTLYKELEECAENDTLFKEKTDQLRKLQQLEADRFSRNRKKADKFDKESHEKLMKEVEAILKEAKIEREAASPFKRLDRVVCKEHQGVELYMGDKGVVLCNVSPENLMEHEDPNEPKVDVVWDAKRRTERDGETYMDCIGNTHTSPKALELADPMPGDPIFLLQALIHDKYYPEIDTEIDGDAGQEKGVWFLDITSEGAEELNCKFSVGYDLKRNFSFCTCGDPGYGPHSDENIEAVEAAFKKTAQLIEQSYQMK